MAECGEGGRQEQQSGRYRLPGGLSPGAPPAVWVTGGVVTLPRFVKPANLVQERQLYRTLVAELRGGLAIDLEPSPDFDRSIRNEEVETISGDEDKYLIVGSSNARRLHKAMKDIGRVAELVYVEQLRIIRGSGEMIRDRMKEVLKEFRPTVVIMQLLDNTAFEVITEDGERLPPQKLDGKTHFAGDIAVIDKVVMRKLLRMCRLALDATEGIQTVFIGPLPRYVTGACCRYSGHMGNRTEPGYFLKMKQDLAAVIWGTGQSRDSS
jgi:hypothetical protein